MNTLRYYALAGLLALSCMLSSCMDTDERILLNPDGSGKAQVTVLMKQMPMGGLNFGGEDAPKPDPAEVAESTAAGLLGGAKGVDAWTNVEWGVTREGLTEFKGIAFFPDISKFQVGSMKSEGLSMSNNDMAWKMEKQADGTITLMMEPTEDSGVADAPREPAPKMTPEEIQKTVQQQRMEFQGMKGMMAPFLSDLKASVMFKVPGQIQSVSSFEKTADDVAKFSYTGMQMLQGMEKIIMDDEAMQKMAEEGQLDEGMQGEPPAGLMEAMFGGEDGVKLTFKPSGAAFDYASEVAKAKAGMSEEIKEMVSGEWSSDSDGLLALESDSSKMKELGDGDFDEIVKKHSELLPAEFETESGRKIKAEVLSVGNAKEDGDEGTADYKVKFSHKGKSETTKISVSFSKSDSGWKANGFSSGGLPNFMGDGLEPISAIGDWVRGN